jgi:hypothetical protein
MKNLCLLYVLLALITLPCVAQTATGKAETTGTCSPAISGSQNRVSIDCRGVSKEEAAKMISILNKILSNQIDPDAVMAKLDEILKAVNPNAGQITYGFNGMRRIISPGRVQGDDGEMSVFARLKSLQDNHDWNRLIEESEAEIKKVPAWLTPYAFKGLAYLNLGKHDEGIKLLEYVDQRTPGNPEFDEVRKVLAAAKLTAH